MHCCAFGSFRSLVVSKTTTLPSATVEASWLLPVAQLVTCTRWRGPAGSLSHTKTSPPPLPLCSRSDVESNAIQRAASP